MNLYLLKYNNYYNRMIKREDNVAGYMPYVLGAIMGGVQFNPADGVNTNFKTDSTRTHDTIGDYMIAVNSAGNIESRWFIMDAQRTRAGQYDLTLRRDLIADYYNELLDAPMFIEKATLQQGDPMIFNNEAMTFNKIKTSEYELRDETGCAWIVGYYAKNDGQNNITTLSGITISNYTTDISLNNLSDWEYYQYINENGTLPVLDNIRVGVKVKLSNGAQKRVITGNGTTSSQNDSTSGNGWYSDYTSKYADVIGGAIASDSTSISDAAEYLGDKSNLLTELLALNGQTIKVGGEKIYKISVKNDQPIDGMDSVAYLSSYYIKLNNIIQNYVNNTFLPNTGYQYQFNLQVGGNSNTYLLYYTNTAYSIVLSELTDKETTYNIGSNRYHLNDAPYDMFAIPYGEIDIYNNGIKLLTTNRSISFNTAMSIANKYAGSNAILYDIQLLPYLPVRQALISGVLDLSGNNLMYTLINQGDTPVGVILNATESTGTFNIEYKIEVFDKKISNECDAYRLVEGNYASGFDFNIAKNNGVDYFNIDYTYKPFSPYIHVSPNFKELYGQDFNGTRGLICSGDYSLPVITDQWEVYQRQNKNYQLIFNRQIENLEVNNSIQRERELWQYGLGIASAGISGAASGGLLAGGAGAAIGLGTALISGAAGARDIQLADKSRAEAINYTKDLYGYNLGNIKALPDTLTKVSAFTANNKIFPLLEYYTCTEKEKQALRDKLKYNGMTVMRIGTLQEFLQQDYSYIKGQLIRLEIGLDTHELNELATELSKGVFIK